MAGTVTQGLLGAEDITRHDPSAGSTTQTLNRDSRLGGGTTPITKMSAANVPLLDAPGTAGWNTPFGKITHTTTEPSVESALADAVKNQTYKNFRRYGGVPNDTSATAGAKNTAVFNQIIADIQADVAATGEPSGIFFPGGTYTFSRTSALGHCLNVPLMSNIEFCGSGEGTVLQVQAASSSYSLFEVVDGVGHSFRNMTLYANGSTQAVVLCNTATRGIGDFRFQNLNIVGGGGIALVATAANQGNRYWIQDCKFSEMTNASTYYLTVTGFLSGHIQRNLMTGTGLGISVTSSTGMLGGETEIVGNYLLGATNVILLVRSGTYSSANHKGFLISGNHISTGDIICSGFNELEIASNFLFAGGIGVQFDAAVATAFNTRLLNNQISGGMAIASLGATGHGIYVLGAGTTLEGLEIAGGRINAAQKHGIMIQMETGRCYYGSIHDVLIKNPNRATGGYSGIYLDDGANKGVKYMNVHHNQIITDTATVPAYGIQQAGTAVCGLNHFNNNIIRGFATADILAGGTSTDTDPFDDGGGLAP